MIFFRTFPQFPHAPTWGYTNSMKMRPYSSVDEYLENFNGSTKQKLESIRKLIKQLVPDSQEKISYGIPTATLDGKYLVYFAGYDKHVSVYPIPPVGDEALQEIINTYRAGKGTLKFPLNKPLPTDFIQAIILAHVNRLRG